MSKSTPAVFAIPFWTERSAAWLEAKACGSETTNSVEPTSCATTGGGDGDGTGEEEVERVEDHGGT